MVSVKFKNKKYKLVITDHAMMRMESRSINEAQVIELVQTGEVKNRDSKNKFWVYKKTLCLAISIEEPNLVVITAMMNWRPNEN